MYSQYKIFISRRCFKLAEVKEEVKPRGRRKRVEPIIDEPLIDEEVIEQKEEANSPTTSYKEPTVGIIAVDNGGDNTKVFSQRMDNPTYFKSRKGFGVEEDFDDPMFHDEEYDEENRSYIVRYKDLIYLTNRRMKQGRFKDTGNTYTKTKAYFIISTLIAVAKYGYNINYVVTSVPYANRTKTEVSLIKERLIGEHAITINDKDYEFTIEDVLVTAEAQAGHFYLEAEGQVTLLELGSRTVGYATNYIELDDEGNIIIDQPIRAKSGTIDRAGVEISNLKETDYIPYCSNIYAELSSIISENDKIIAFGGGVLVDGIREGLKMNFNNIHFAQDPLYVQVRGMLIAGELYFNLEEDDE